MEEGDTKDPKHGIGWLRLQQVEPWVGCGKAAVWFCGSARNLLWGPGLVSTSPRCPHTWVPARPLTSTVGQRARVEVNSLFPVHHCLKVPTSFAERELELQIQRGRRSRQGHTAGRGWEP